MDKIIKEIERNRILAKELMETGTPAFIIDTDNTWHWCYILSIDENRITFKNFYGNKVDIEQSKFWAEVFRVKKYKSPKERGDTA